MSNNNVAIVSLMAKFDEKSINQAAQKLGKTTEQALSNIGQDKFGQEIVNQFNEAIDIVKKKLKGVNLSSYTGSILDSLISDKDIAEKTKDLQKFISNIFNLSKSLSGLGSNALNSMTTKQLDAIIAKQEKIAKKNEEIATKTKELESTAKNIAGQKRSVSTIKKSYGELDDDKSYKSLQKVLTTETEFDNVQQKSIKHLSEMLTLYSEMEKVEPVKGTTEAIKHSANLLTVAKEIKKTTNEIDLFTGGKASKFVSENFDSIKKINQYGTLTAQQDYVKNGLKNFNAQKVKLEKDLTEYIGQSVQKNVQKIASNAEQVIDKTAQKVDKLQEKVDNLKGTSSSDKPIIDNIVDESQFKTLEELEDRLYSIYDKDSEGDASTKELKEFISLYQQYEKLISNATDGTKLDPELKEEYDFIIKKNDAMQKYADSIKEAKTNKDELLNVDSSSQTSAQLKEQETHIQNIEKAENDLADTQKTVSNTSITVDAEKAIESIKRVKENLDSIPDEKNIKVTVNNTDYSSVPLLSNEEGKTVNMFRGVKNAWSGLVNDKGIGFFTDKLELAVDYADELAKDGKVIQANLSLHNPLEVEGNGARWDQIDFEGVKQKTDDIIEKAKQLGYDGVIFKNIRDGFTDAESDLSNVVAVFDAMSVKNEQVIGTVKAGTGELTKIESTTNSIADTVVDSQNKIQSELKETQAQAEETAQAIKEVSSAPQESNISSGMKDAFPNSSTDTKPETESMEQVEKATEEAVQAKKEFATANEGVQSSIDGSENPLKLEAELMEQIAKSAREAADAKKEFVEANKQVEKSADDSNSELKDTPKKDKYAKRNKISEDDFLNDSSKYTSIANSRLISSGNTILGNTVNADLVDGLVKVTAKIKDADGVWKTFSARIDADGNMFNQRFKAITKGVNQLEDDLKKFGKDKVKSDLTDIQIAKYQELENAIKNYEKISKRIASNSAYDGDEKSASNLLDTINEIMGKTNGGITVLSNEQLNKAQNKLDNIDQTISDIKQKTNISEFKNLEKFQSSAINKLNPYTNDTKYTIDFINKVNNLQKQIANFNLSNQSDVDRLKAIDAEIKNITKESNLLKNKLVKQKSNLAEIVSQMKIFKSQNTNMSRSQKAELDQIINYAETMQRSGEEVASEVENIKVRFTGLKAEVNETGKAGKNFFDRIGNRLSDMNSKFVAQFLSWQDWIRYIQQGISTIRDLDEAMTEVRKVSSATDAQYESFQKTISSTAKEIASTNKELLNSSADFLRLGYSLDEASDLAKNATLFVNVGDGVDVNTATEDMITAMKAFDIQAKDSIKIVDSYNQIGNKFALSATDIGEAMKRSASALETGNNSFKESIALITAMNEIVQNSENTGNTLKVFSLRLRGAKAELEDMGEDTDGLCESSSKLREQLQALTGVDIMLNDNTFKSTTQIVKELGATWDKLSDSSQAAALELVAGKTRANNVAALLKNYKQIDNVLGSLEDAEGSALKENEAIVDSINGRIKTLSATAEEFWQKFINTDFVKNVVSLASDLLGLLTKIVDKFGTIPTLATAISAALSFKNVGIDTLVAY